MAGYWLAYFSPILNSIIIIIIMWLVVNDASHLIHDKLLAFCIFRSIAHTSSDWKLKFANFRRRIIVAWVMCDVCGVMVDGALLCCFLCFQMFHSVVVHALPTPTPASIVSTVRITHRWPTYTIGLEGQTSKMYHEPQNKEGQYHQQRDTENTMRIEATGHYLAKNEKIKTK